MSLHFSSVFSVGVGGLGGGGVCFVCVTFVKHKMALVPNRTLITVCSLNVFMIAALFLCGRAVLHICIYKIQRTIQFVIFIGTARKRKIPLKPVAENVKDRKAFFAGLKALTYLFTSQILMCSSKFK